MACRSKTAPFAPDDHHAEAAEGRQYGLPTRRQQSRTHGASENEEGRDLANLRFSFTLDPVSSCVPGFAAVELGTVRLWDVSQLAMLRLEKSSVANLRGVAGNPRVSCYAPPMSSYLLWWVMGLASLLWACGESANCEATGCDDGSVCTADVCNPESGACETTNVADASVCTVDGATGACIDGVCILRSCEGVECDDGNPCTTDACFEGLGACVGVAVPDMSTCEVDGAFGRCNGTQCDLTIPPVGDAELQLAITGVDASLVGYELGCAGDLALFGTFAKVGDEWEASFTLPAGACSIQVAVQDADGEVICTGTDSFTILPAITIALDLTLTCTT